MHNIIIANRCQNVTQLDLLIPGLYISTFQVYLSYLFVLLSHDVKLLYICLMFSRGVKTKIKISSSGQF